MEISESRTRELLPLYAELQGHPKLEIVKHYARACVSHATAAQAAEIERLKVVAHGFVDEIAARETKIEALREQLDWIVKQNDMLLDEGRKLTARAERLADALRDARDRMLGQVKWVACDCGCERDKPADAASVVWLRAIALLRDQEVGNG